MNYYEILLEQQERVLNQLAKTRIEKTIIDIEMKQYELMLMNINLQLEEEHE